MNSGNSGYDSNDYTNTNMSSSLFTASPKVQSPISNQTNPIAPKANSFTATSPFKIFNILKSKTKPDQNAVNLQQQQQQQKELQQQNDPSYKQQIKEELERRAKHARSLGEEDAAIAIEELMRGGYKKKSRKTRRLRLK